MVILRLLSYLLIAATLMLLGYDAINWLQSTGSHHLLSLSDFIGMFLGQEKATSLSESAGPAKVALSWPVWAYTGIIGLIFAFVSRGHG